MTTRTTWNADAAHSAVEFAVKHMMFTTVRGRFRDVKATVTVDEDSPDRSKVDVEIVAASLDTSNADRDAHLRSADFFDVERYPGITFYSKRITGARNAAGDRFTVLGDLVIRGQSREVTLDCVYLGSGKDPWGNVRAGAEASTRVDRREWGLTWNQALETGGVLIGNEIQVAIQLQAIKAVPVESIA